MKKKSDERINSLYQAVNDSFDLDISTYFNDNLKMSDIMKNHFNVISNEAIRDEVTMDVIVEELADYYLVAALYATIFSKNISISNFQLGGATFYSYFLLSRLNCDENKKRGGAIVLMRKACHLWSSLFLSKQYDKALIVGDDFINSINGTNSSIIRYGCRLYPEAWFLIDLYSLSTGKTYDKRRADYPADMSPYLDVLDEWNTEDLTKVDNFVSLLGEEHLLTTEYEDEDDSEEEYLTFHHPLLKLYPYEAIVYLAIREISGLKNPKKYSHPLMNTPIAKFFLALETPLKKPKDLPYAKELLVKLKEKCPDIEIPDWV